MVSAGPMPSRICISALFGAGFGAAVFLGAPAPEPPAIGPISFENRQPASGIRFVLDNGTTPDKPIIDSVLGGVALFDFNNDGLLDIYFTNGATIPGLTKDAPEFYNRLYRNNGDGTFTDVTVRAGVAGSGYSTGVAVGDYNNDGFADLFVAGVNRNILYRNNGDGTFTDVSQKAAVTGADAAGRKPWSMAPVWFDYDNDGWLDLFVANYVDWAPDKNKICGEPAHRLSCTPELYNGLPNLLYHNNGDGTFTDVSAATGIADHVGKGMSVAIADYDGDGFMDVFVTNDREPNFLLHNIGGRRFEEVGVESGVGFTGDGKAVSSMGTDFRDVNDDGRPDVLTTALQEESFGYFVNRGGGLFNDTAFQAGLGYASIGMSGWGIGAYDLDNDGHKDLFTSNSHVHENVAFYGMHHYRQRNAVFRNDGHGGFRNVTSTAGPGLRIEATHRGCAFGDLNNDGRIDVVVSAIGSPAELLYNSSSRVHHWLLIQTVGRSSNRDGIGTRIRLVTGSGLTQYNHVTTASGYASSSDRRVHFGLGEESSIREIELRWPSGQMQVLRDVRVDQVLKVVEP